MTKLRRWIRSGILLTILTVFPILAWSAPYAAMVMDARTGEVLFEKNSNTRLHPASLTKMMTLYIAFDTIERGRASLDSVVTVSANAAQQPPSRLGLRAGQKIQLRYLLRAAAVKSANDAASAIGDYLGGNEAGFATKMNRMAKVLGMTNTTFQNANGLTRAGHMSSARDMTILGRHLIYDFPQYYNLFSRRTIDAGVANVASTNRRFLDAYDGADGIKTGYTVAAGFNLVASAQRGNKRVIATVFGGTSTAQRNSKVAELLDMGFARAPNRVTPSQQRPALVARAQDISGPEVGGQVEASDEEEAPARVAAAPAANAANNAPGQSPRPTKRPGSAEPAVVAEAPHHDAEAEAIAAALSTQSIASTRPAPREERVAEAVAAEPVFDPDMPAEGDAEPATGFFQSTQPQPETLAMARKQPRNDTVILANVTPAPAPRQTREVVSRDGTGRRNWGINVGRYPSQYAAEQFLLTTALMESDTLSDALREVQKSRTGFEANFVGMSKSSAELACARLTARATKCSVVGP